MIRLMSVIFISLWGLLLRFNFLNERVLWNDELYQLHRMIGVGLKPFWQRLSYSDLSCFPGDYLLTYPFVKLFGENKWGIAIPHIIMTIAGFFFLYLLCKRYFRTFRSYAIAFSIVGFNTYLIFHSFEFRPYAVLPTLAIMSCYCADVLASENMMMGFLKKFFIGLFFVMTMWFHAFGILIVFFPLVFFTLSHKKDISKGTLKFIAVIFLIALPVWLWYATGNPMGITREWRIAVGHHTFQFMWSPLSGFWHFFNRIIFYDLIGCRYLFFLMAGALLLMFRSHTERLRKIAFFLVCIILPIEILLLIALHMNYWFLPRQYIYLVPMMAFFLGWVWDTQEVRQ